MTLDERLADIAPLLRQYIKELQDVYGCGDVLYVDSDHTGGTDKTITFAATTHKVTVSDT
jgi:hypothetical protein